MSLTVAPLMAAAVGSCTEPVTVPLVTWATAVALKMLSVEKIPKMTARFRPMDCSMAYLSIESDCQGQPVWFLPESFRGMDLIRYFPLSASRITPVYIKPRVRTPEILAIGPDYAYNMQLTGAMPISLCAMARQSPPSGCVLVLRK
jgi:hypothetical protein